MLRSLVVCACMSSVLGSVARADTAALRTAALRTAIQSISKDELQRHVDVLADDTFEGREAGSRGGRAASVYLRKYFEQRNLKGAGNNGGFFQEFGAGYRNVLGLWEGSDPALRHEVVVVGAHYDHVGYGTRRNSYGPFGYIHNGADDNASGVAGLLELIEAIQHLPEPPKRSILFALWDGEEKGLLGSKHWTARPTIDIERLVFAFNIDMIGRLREELQVFGVRSGNALRRIVTQVNDTEPLTLKFDWTMKSNSDHHSFFAIGVPVLMFHTGLHDDYHRPSDDAHKLNVGGMQRVARLYFHAVNAIASSPRRIPYRGTARSDTESVHLRFTQPREPLPPRLGAGWKRNEDATLTVEHVVAGSPADKAGLRVGDRLLKFNGKPLPADDDELRLRIVGAKAEIQWARRSSDGTEETIRVQLTGTPVRIGVSWRTDAADPSNAVLTLVHPGSAADVAGLVPGDRILKVNGTEFDGDKDLMKRLVESPSPIRLLIDRRGRPLDVELRPLPPERARTAEELSRL